MGAALEKAKSHFRERLENAWQTIEVPEWGEPGAPLVITYRPMNLKQQDAIYKYVQENSLASLVETLIQRARDVDHKPIFRPVDRRELMSEVDPKVIERIVSAMADDISAEDAEKNY